jgi:hypothetical protein
METQDMAFGMLALEQTTPLAASPCAGMTGLDKEYRFNIMLHRVACQVLQYRTRMGVRAIIERQQKTDVHCFHKAFFCSALLLTTLPVQI